MCTKKEKKECSAAILKSFAACFVARSDQSLYFFMTPSAGLERQEDELQSLCTLMQDSLRQHEDELNNARRNSEEKISSVRQKLLEDVDRVRQKDEELEELERQRIEDAKKSASEQEAKMYELRAQWEEQRQKLRGLHSEHLKEAAVKDQRLRERAIASKFRR